MTADNSITGMLLLETFCSLDHCVKHSTLDSSLLSIWVQHLLLTIANVKTGTEVDANYLFGPKTEGAPNPYYAGGHVFMDSILDALICQAYYNPHIAGSYFIFLNCSHQQPAIIESLTGGNTFTLLVGKYAKHLIVCIFSMYQHQFVH